MGKKKGFIQTIHFLRNFPQEFPRNEICIERKFSIFDRILHVEEYIREKEWQTENAFRVSSRKFANGYYPFPPLFRR